MRCNVGVPPKILLDQHLIAEYRELLIPYAQLIHLMKKHPSKHMNSFLTDIPFNFKLGKGHVIFWRNKNQYLRERHAALVGEMKRRNFHPKLKYWSVSQTVKETEGDWECSEKDTTILRNRILERVHQKPRWYRYFGVSIPSFKFYEKLLMSSEIEC